jgi:predicted AAA+ superfamily ATPase
MREVAIPRISALKTLSEKLRTPLGGLIENAVLLQLLEGSGGFYEISSWKKSSHDLIEVDFIYKNIDTSIPIEVKSALNVSKRHGKNSAAYLFESEQKHGILLSLDKPKELYYKDCRIKNIPVYLFNRQTIDKIMCS